LQRPVASTTKIRNGGCGTRQSPRLLRIRGVAAMLSPQLRDNQAVNSYGRLRKVLGGGGGGGGSPRPSSLTPPAHPERREVPSYCGNLAGGRLNLHQHQPHHPLPKTPGKRLTGPWRFLSHRSNSGDVQACRRVGAHANFPPGVSNARRLRIPRTTRERCACSRGRLCGRRVYLVHQNGERPTNLGPR